MACFLKPKVGLRVMSSRKGKALLAIETYSLHTYPFPPKRQTISKLRQKISITQHQISKFQNGSMPTLKSNSPLLENMISVGMNGSLSPRTLKTCFNRSRQQGTGRDAPQGQCQHDGGPCQDPSFMWQAAGSLPTNKHNNSQQM